MQASQCQQACRLPLLAGPCSSASKRQLQPGGPAAVERAGRRTRCWMMRCSSSVRVRSSRLWNRLSVLRQPQGGVAVDARRRQCRRRSGFERRRWPVAGRQRPNGRLERLHATSPPVDDAPGQPWRPHRTVWMASVPCTNILRRLPASAGSVFSASLAWLPAAKGGGSPAPLMVRLSSDGCHARCCRFGQRAAALSSVPEAAGFQSAACAECTAGNPFPGDRTLSDFHQQHQTAGSRPASPMPPPG